MGCDIHSFAEKKNRETGKWEKVGNAFTLDSFDREMAKKDKDDHPFCWRSYSLFSFLAGVRNYDRCEPLSKPKGMPKDVSDDVKSEWEMWEPDGHSASFLTLRELCEFDYEKVFWNRRITKQLSQNSWTGAALAEEGEGKMISYRQNLGEMFFIHLEDLKVLGDPDDVRIVFWFDN